MRLLRRRKIRSLVLLGMLSLGIGAYSVSGLPDGVWINEGSQYTFDDGLNLFGSIEQTAGAGTSEASFRLFGVVPLKKVNLTVTKPMELIPGGYPTGIRFVTDGVMVVGMGNVETADGLKNPAYDAGVRVKDIILKVNGKKVGSSKELGEHFRASGGKAVTLTVKRNNATIKIQVSPAKSAQDGLYRAGLWVRDSTAGIGTITYIDPATGRFGALGHGISDIDTGEIMPLSTGSVLKAVIIDIRKGVSGDPGELKGIFMETENTGRLYKNTEEGIYGQLNEGFYKSLKTVKVGYKQDVTEGEAVILSCIDGSQPKVYKIEIVRAYKSGHEKTKNMLIRVTDSELLQKTGGIVQGMSGSPILQNGKLIGAVTHVLVNDPARGYGIFIENMLQHTAELKTAA